MANYNVWVGDSPPVIVNADSSEDAVRMAADYQSSVANEEAMNVAAVVTNTKPAAIRANL